MWEDRKYVVPHTSSPGMADMGHRRDVRHRETAAGNGFGNSAYDPTEDLHAWSIYRQNLNADLSESAIGLNKGPNNANEKPFGNFQLKESTVNNILTHPKYGPSTRNHDPYTYLRFGLPRVKPVAAQSELGGRNMHRGGSHGLTSDSASVSGDESPIMKRRMNGRIPNGPGPMDDSRNKRIWKSNPDLMRGDGVAESNFILSNGDYNNHSNHKHKNGHTNGNAMRPHSRGNPSSHHPHANGVKTTSEMDLRSNPGHQTAGSGNQHFGGFGSKIGTGTSSVINGSSGRNQLPHLIIRNLYYEVDKTSNFRKFCGAQRQKLRILDNISFEVKSGEILAIMATNAGEGTAILDVMANRFNKRNGRVKGDFILNGVYMSPSKLSDLVSYVNQEINLCPDMTARQTLLFSSLLQKAAKRNDFDPKKKTYALLEELGLSEVRHTCVSSLTEAEKRRLLIAVSLLLDTDILILDQPVKGMDIFDTFFLVEYLRQWAQMSGRCVIMTIHPTTFEIFSMLSRVALISTGRVLYFGKRKDLLSYFSYIDYPCPAFKNPSDYYLDLVTLDNLSSEAMIESSQRIDNLAEMFARRHSAAANVSLPGPPSATPPPPKRSGFAIQFLALWIRALIFTFPYNVIHLFRNLFICLLVSMLVGVIYWHVRVGREQEHLWDRIGLYHALLSIAPLPFLLVIMKDAHAEKEYVLNEVSQGLYSRPAFFFAKFIYSIPSATLSFVAFALPACSMAGLHNELSLYLLLMIVYQHALRAIALCCAWTFTAKSSASTAFALIFSILVLTSGTTIHFKDLSIATQWLYPASLLRWTHESLVGWEFSSNVTLALSTASWVSTSLPYLCSHNPIIQQENAILIKADCGFQSRPNILSWFSYRGGASGDSSLRPFSHALVSGAAVFAAFAFLSLIAFLAFARRKRSNNQPCK